MIAVFDVGATNTRIGLSADGKTLAKRHIEPTPQTKGGWKQLVSQAEKLAEGEKIKAAAGGFPGVINQDTGVFYNPVNLKGWDGVQLRRPLERLVGSGAVALDNDTAVVGLGEAYKGGGQATGIMAYVTVSSGVNGVRIVNGKIDVKAKGFELGRQLLLQKPDGWQTLEQLIGGKAMQERFGRLPKQVDDPTVWHQETHYLAVGLYNLTLTWSPDEIVLGGRMMRDIPLDWLRVELQSLPQVFDKLPVIRPATLDEWGGLYGGLELVRQRGFKP